MTTHIDNLLEQAYDAEKSGALELAASLRALAHAQRGTEETPPPAVLETPIAPDVWADLMRVATALYEQGKRDAERAILRELTSAVLDDQPPPAVQVEHWQSENGTPFTDFTIGDGLTKVLIGGYDGDKAGIDLVIGGTGINEGIDEVITLRDVQVLRDNLTAVLARLGSPTIYTEHLYHEEDEDGDLTDEPIGPLAYVDYCAGEGDAKVAISFDVGGRYAPDVDLGDQPSIKLDRFLTWLPNVLALLSSEQVQQARARWSGQPAKRKAA